MAGASNDVIEVLSEHEESGATLLHSDRTMIDQVLLKLQSLRMAREAEAGFKRARQDRVQHMRR